MSMSDEKHKVIGKERPLSHSNEKVTGKFEFVNDMPIDLETLHVKVLRSPHPHAKIKSIDTSEAEKIEGVEYILTPENVPDRRIPRTHHRNCLILDNHLRYVGDEVVAVAAIKEKIAEKALDSIEVKYELLNPVYDPREAMEDEAPEIWPETNVYGPRTEYLAERLEGVKEPTAMEWGDVEKGLEEADVVVEESFEIGPEVHTPMEPHVTVANYDGEELTIWTPSQCPYEVRESMAHLLSFPESKVRVISKAVGGGFGGKYVGRWQAIPAYLALKTGKPVKYRYTREEEQIHSKRPQYICNVKVGAEKNGTLTAISYEAFIDIGGYGSNFSGTCALWGESPLTAYKFENAKIEAWDVNTNRFNSQAFRTPHQVPLSIPMESLIDEVSKELEMDPAELRIKNMPEKGDVTPPKPYKVNTTGFPRYPLDTYPGKEILREVLDRIEWRKKWPETKKHERKEGEKLRGVGISNSITYSGQFFSCTQTQTVVINCDGSVTIMSGHQDIGTGSDDTLKMLAAESFDLPIEDIHMKTGDTSTCQYDLYAARGSSELARGGHILLNAIEDAKRKVKDLSSEVLEAEPEEIEVRNKKAYIRNKPEKNIPLSDLLTTTVVGTARGEPRKEFEFVEEDGTRYKLRQPLLVAAEVEIDPETYDIELVKLVTGNNPGKMINPKVVEGQYKGGAIMALSYILYEEVKYDEETGGCLNNDLTDYRVARSHETPEIETVIFEEATDRPAHKGLPYGAQGVGENGFGATPAAIVNAISNALGIRCNKTPITPEKILEMMEEENQNE